MHIVPHCRFQPHFNPRSLHGERPSVSTRSSRFLTISIHAPCTGSDGSWAFCGINTFTISIHAPCTGSDTHSQYGFQFQWKFQSTLPARGATRHMSLEPRQFLISIHAPCTGSDVADTGYQKRHDKFQSTLPARGATLFRWAEAQSATFQSTLPARGATRRLRACPTRLRISIHAPCTGSDPPSLPFGRCR